MNSPLREIRRVRHEIEQRRLLVDKITAFTPKMLRITLAGAELAGFTSLGFDDHIKLFFPKESMIEKQSFIGDETALPAIGRRPEELPADSPAVVIAEVEDAAEEQSFASKAKLRVHWVHRHGAPAGSSDGPSAAESNVARALRRVLIDERGINRSRVKAAGYWKRGAAAVHDAIED